MAHLEIIAHSPVVLPVGATAPRNKLASILTFPSNLIILDQNARSRAASKRRLVQPGSSPTPPAAA